MGQATALKWRDVDFDRARIEVRASVERVDGSYRFGTDQDTPDTLGPDPSPGVETSAGAHRLPPTVWCSPARPAL